MNQEYVASYRWILDLHGYDGYPWRVHILMVPSQSSHGQMPINNIHLPMDIRHGHGISSQLWNSQSICYCTYFLPLRLPLLDTTVVLLPLLARPCSYNGRESFPPYSTELHNGEEACSSWEVNSKYQGQCAWEEDSAPKWDSCDSTGHAL